MKDQRFIEESFPIREVSTESAKEKSIRHGHISTLHLWWARRPLASSRATNYAALIPSLRNSRDIQRMKEFIIKLSRWDNSLDCNLLDTARKQILESHDGKPPRVLDPFSGGGAIPLEALRLGCETYANDYNPVANLILRCTVEYPQKYGNPTFKGLSQEIVDNPLIHEIRKWGTWILNSAKNELAVVYPNEKDGSVPVGYLWARTVPCQNPRCGIEIPLMRAYWLARKGDKKIMLYPYVEKKQVKFKIIGSGYEAVPKDFDPEKGTTSQAIVTCPSCGSAIDGNMTRGLFANGKAGQRMLVVVLHKEGVVGKSYRISNDHDIKVFNEAEKMLESKREQVMQEFGIDPIPDEIIPSPDGEEYVPGKILFRFNSVVLYGMTKWRDIFNMRQKLSLAVFVEKVKASYKKMLEQGYDAEYAKVITSYLAIIVSRLVDKNATLAVYNVVGEKIEHVFGRQALAMVWDYAEVNPFTDVGWPNMQNWVELVVDHCSQIPDVRKTTAYARVMSFSAVQMPFPDNTFDAVFTDPPYYDNVPYSYISDFFYVWLKRLVGELYPELFVTPLTPKSGEIIAELPLIRGMNKDLAMAKFSNIKTSVQFEKMLSQCFKEINRVLKPNGISIIVYAHKSTAGWETLINSILDSGLVVTAAWPIHTERTSRLNATETAALASSIYITARKITRQPVGFYKEVKNEIKQHLSTKLDKLWHEGISGADFFIAAIGSSIEVFGKYERIIDDEGNVIRADKLLEEIRRVVIDFAVKQVLHNGFAVEISQMTRFYVLWRWAYGEASVVFDDARKLAQSASVDLANTWNKGFISKNKEFIKVLGPHERKVEELDDSKELIDILHRVLLLWNKSKNEEVVNILKETGFGESDVFYRVAQAISESLPNDSKEKKLLEGFLAGKERISKDVRKESGQRRLFE